MAKPRSAIKPYCEQLRYFIERGGEYLTDWGPRGPVFKRTELSQRKCMAYKSRMAASVTAEQYNAKVVAGTVRVYKERERGDDSL